MQKKIFLLLTLAFSFGCASALPQTNHNTQVSIHGEDFYINGQPTYAGRTWNGHRIEGLLLNARLVQGIFDDLNLETTNLWIYPDTGKWDAERLTLCNLPGWRKRSNSSRGRSSFPTKASRRRLSLIPTNRECTFAFPRRDRATARRTILFMAGFTAAASDGRNGLWSFYCMGRATPSITISDFR
jgi:hypothetical protein